MVFMTIGKVAIRAPRPFFIMPELVSQCKVAEFGSPSGHSLVAATCYLATASVTLRFLNSSNLVRASTYAFIVAPIVLYTGISRIYFGMHSLDQVISGTLQGVIISYLFCDLLYERLDLFL